MSAVLLILLLILVLLAVTVWFVRRGGKPQLRSSPSSRDRGALERPVVPSSNDPSRQAEGRYRDLFENAPVMYIITRDVDGAPVIDDCNATFSATLGYTKSELIGQPVTTFYTPESARALQREGYRDALAAGIRAVPRTLIRKDGTRVPTLLQAYPWEQEGRALGTRAMYVDISQQVRAEEKAAQLGKILEESLNEIYIFAAKDLRFVEVNQAARDNLGYTLEELRGMTPLDLKCELTRDEFKALIAPLAAGEQKKIEFNARHRRKDGSRYPVEAHLQAGRLGETPVYVCMILDTSSRMAAQAEIEAREQQFRTFMDASPSAIYSKTPDRRFIFVNRRFSEWYGFPAEKIIDRTSDELFAAEQAREYRAHDEEVLNRGEMVERQLKVPYADGTLRETLMIKFPLFDADGQIVALGGINIDMTEQHALEEQLRQVQKMEAIGTLAGGIAHDFNNILTIITNHLKLAGQALPAENPAAPHLEQIDQASRRATELVRQILAFSRQETLGIIPLRVDHVLQDTLQLLRATIPATVEIDHAISPAVKGVRALANPTQLQQVLINLCANAVHAMADKGKLRIRLDLTTLGPRSKFLGPDKPPGDYLKLTVKDSGHGMSEDLLDKIFDPFFTTKRVGEGSGMGLSVVHGIIEGYGGMIAARSMPDKGSTFDIFLPATGEISSEPLPTAQIDERGDERVLLVDDEESVAHSTGLLLEFQGFGVTVHTDSREALKTFKRAPEEFDLVITDQAMPAMSGLELAAELLKIRPGMPIVLISGYSNRALEEKCRQLGVRELCPKPMEIQRLVRVIRKVLDEPA